MFGSRKGASGAGTLLMIVAFLGIGGFMYWLNQTAVSAARKENPTMSSWARLATSAPVSAKTKTEA